jgi:hypothetical protein
MVMSIAHAYTPGLKVKRATILRKTRRLPIKGKTLVKEGDTVSFDTLVAETQLSGNIHVVEVAAILGVEPEDIRRYILKKEGDPVEKGDVIAIYKSFFGLFKTICKSPEKGTIEYISDITGRVIVREPPVPINIKAYIPGTVVKVLPNEGAIIETQAAFIQGIYGIGGETYGEIMVSAKNPKEILTAKEIDESCSGKVIVGGSLVTGGALKKAVGVGAKGIISGGIEDNDLADLLGYEVGGATTGHEEAGITLIITEGFGKMEMSDRTFNLLKSFDGYHASICGATQIRAGVLRPEVIIPHKVKRSELKEDLDEFAGGIKTGSLIRVIRDPYFGTIGRVVSLPVKPQEIETESHVRVLEAILEDGRKVFVPRANVEIIEE